MKFVLALFIFYSPAIFAVDVGDGSDGTCDVTGGATTQITAARRSYQCTTLNINGPLNGFFGGAALVIKVQGLVVVNSPIDMSGAAGSSGSGTPPIAGGAGGANAGAGGSSTNVDVSGSNGVGTGAGIGGTHVSIGGNNSTYGGGGGGGTYQTISATTPVDGLDDTGITAPGTAGSNGATIYGSEASFDTSFPGGSGGGAGGGGYSGGAPVTGSSGGGGGGAIRIIAGGNITVNADITSNGGDGGGALTTSNSGAGGGGSGGSIWLQSAGAISGAGNIVADGGAQGVTDLGDGNGGGGGKGRIRLDDSDGVHAITGTVDPVPYQTTFSPTPIPTTSGTSAISRQYSSSISCAKVADENINSHWSNLLIGFGITFLLYGFSRRGKV